MKSNLYVINFSRTQSQWYFETGKYLRKSITFIYNLLTEYKPITVCDELQASNKSRGKRIGLMEYKNVLTNTTLREVSMEKIMH